MKLSVVIPVYNEKDTIRDICRCVNAVDIDIDKEVILVDDFSTDGTRDILPELADETTKVYLHDRNRGKGAALRTGFSKASGDVIVVQDADLEYDPADYAKLIKPIIENKADVVYGSRFIGGEQRRVLFFWHMLGNKLLTFFSNMLTNLNLTDMETCYKMFTRGILEKLDVEEDRFGFEPEFTAKVARMGVRVYEVGISYSGRSYREGKKVGWKDGLSALRCIVKYNLFPLARHCKERHVNLAASGMNTTRGYGLLEGLLARHRAKTADGLIPEGSRAGKVLDIGCGSYPLFLLNTRFHEKHGLDKLADPNQCAPLKRGVLLGRHDLESGQRLCYEDGHFDVVTMLAVIEHIKPDALAAALREVRRVMKPQGVLILTAPAGWTDFLLRTMSRLRLVSAEEINEHKDTYSHEKLLSLLERAGFERKKTRFGYFELFMNLWVTASK